MDLSEKEHQLYLSYNKKKRDDNIDDATEEERNAHNAYHRWYRMQPHRNDKAKEFSKSWKKRNKERDLKSKREWSRKWYSENKEESRERMKKYYRDKKRKK